MPSPIAHFSLIALLTPFERRGVLPASLLKHRKALPCFVLFALVLPDIDFGIGLFAPATALGTHAHGMHSIVMTTLAAALLAGLWRLLFRSGTRVVFPVLLIAAWSHLVLDMLTQGGPGIALLWPFSEVRIGSPIRVFYGVKHSQPGAWPLHLITLTTELAFAAVVWWIARKSAKQTESVQEVNEPIDA